MTIARRRIALMFTIVVGYQVTKSRDIYSYFLTDPRAWVRAL